MNNERGIAMQEQRDSIARVWAEYPCPESFVSLIVHGTPTAYWCKLKVESCHKYETGKPCEIYQEFINKVREEK